MFYTTIQLYNFYKIVSEELEGVPPEFVFKVVFPYSIAIKELNISKYSKIYQFNGDIFVNASYQNTRNNNGVDDIILNNVNLFASNSSDIMKARLIFGGSYQEADFDKSMDQYRIIIGKHLFKVEYDKINNDKIKNRIKELLVEFKKEEERKIKNGKNTMDREVSPSDN